jgi:uncharacterized protein YciI
MNQLSKRVNNSQNNERRFIYFYFNRNEPEKIGHLVPAHIHYWKTAKLKEYIGGPFGDRTGGLISFAALSIEEATKIVLRDPFVLENLIAEKWIKEWIIE